MPGPCRRSTRKLRLALLAVISASFIILVRIGPPQNLDLAPQLQWPQFKGKVTARWRRRPAPDITSLPKMAAPTPLPLIITSRDEDMVENEEVVKLDFDKLPLFSQLQRKASASLEGQDDQEWKLDNSNIPEVSRFARKIQIEGRDMLFSPPVNCANFPDLNRVHFSNEHWQTQKTRNETYYLYSAFLDLRSSRSALPVLSNGTAVRVLAMADVKLRTSWKAQLKVCQYWFSKGNRPKFGEISKVKLIWRMKFPSGAYFPYLITCELPKGSNKVPISVSLVSGKCDNATNNLRIRHAERATQSLQQRTPQKDFVVCVKGLNFPGKGMAPRLVEWIEMVRILGGDKIIFYEYFVDSKIKQILAHYKEQGFVDVVPMTMPGRLPNQAQLRHLYMSGRGNHWDKSMVELIPYNDCLYRNIYDYKYVLLLDTDELIVPSERITWSELLSQVKERELSEGTPLMSSYCFRNHYFYDANITGRVEEDIPPEFDMLRRVHRSGNHTLNGHGKCFHSTDLSAGLHNHSPFFCRDGVFCSFYFGDVARAKLHHYRDCYKGHTCSKMISYAKRDTTMWKYKDELVPRVQAMLAKVQ